MGNFAAYEHRHELVDMAIMARVSEAFSLPFVFCLIIFLTVPIVAFQFNVSIIFVKLKRDSCAPIHYQSFQ